MAENVDAPVRGPDLPHHYQATDYTCGPAILKMVLDGVLGVEHDEALLADAMGTDPEVGTRQRVLLAYARKFGLSATERHTDTTMDDLRALVRGGRVVVVCYWIPSERIDHYAIVHRITPKDIVLRDPWFGPETTLALGEFEANWRSDPTVATRRHRWLMAIEPPRPAQST